jgi:hypothetical protein
MVSSIVYRDRATLSLLCQLRYRLTMRDGTHNGPAITITGKESEPGHFVSGHALLRRAAVPQA